MSQTSQYQINPKSFHSICQPKDSTLSRKNAFGWLIFVLPLIFILASCAENLNDNTATGPDENFTGITLCIPDMKSNNAPGKWETRGGWKTRGATLEWNKDETTINNLYLLAIKSDNLNKTLLFNLSLDYFPSKANGYSQYKIALKEGSYYFYLLANLDDYIDGGVESLSTKSAIENAVMNFEDIATYQTLSATNLPMACLAGEIKVNNQSSSSASPIDIKRNPLVYATMTFLCSKVRYTILLDETDGTPNNVDFAAVEASKVAKTGKLAATTGSNWNGQFFDTTISLPDLKKVEFPNDEAGTSGYLTIEAQSQAPDNLAEIDNLYNWESQPLKAWQNIVYLPENPSTAGGATTLRFPAFDAEGNELEPDYSFPATGNVNTPLERGQFYDIVARLKVSADNPLPEVENVSYKIFYKTSLGNMFVSDFGDYRGMITNNKITVISELYNTWYCKLPDYSNEPNVTFKYSFSSTGDGATAKISDTFERIELADSIYYVAYLDGNNLKKGFPTDLITPFSEGQGFEIYIPDKLTYNGERIKVFQLILPDNRIREATNMTDRSQNNYIDRGTWCDDKDFPYYIRFRLGNEAKTVFTPEYIAMAGDPNFKKRDSSKHTWVLTLGCPPGCELPQ